MEKKTLTSTDFAKVQWVMDKNGKIAECIGLDKENDFVKILYKRGTNNLLRVSRSPFEITPILRPMSDVTEEEKDQHLYLSEHLLHKYPESSGVDYLDSIQVDCRGWLYDGLAIDATTLGERNPFKK